MDPKQAYLYSKWCHDNAIRIYPVPTTPSGGTYTICVERDGICSIGKIIFEDKATKFQKSVWEQINELYKLIYQRENKE